MKLRCVMCGGTFCVGYYPVFNEWPIRTCSERCAAEWNKLRPLAAADVRRELAKREAERNKPAPFAWLADFAVRLVREAIRETAGPREWRPERPMDEIPVRLERFPLAPHGKEETSWRGRHEAGMELAWGDVPRKEWPCRFGGRKR